MINQFIRKVLQIEFIRFAIVGCLATAIHYAIYYVLLSIISANVSYTIGYLVSFCFNFLLSAKFTFNAEATAKKGVGFALSHLINYAMQLLVLNVILRLGVSDSLAPIPVFLICIPVNFLMVRFVFKKV